MLVPPGENIRPLVELTLALPDTPPSVSVPSTTVRNHLIFRTHARTSGDIRPAAERIRALCHIAFLGLARQRNRSPHLAVWSTRNRQLVIGAKRHLSPSPCCRGSTRLWLRYRRQFLAQIESGSRSVTDGGHRNFRQKCRQPCPKAAFEYRKAAFQSIKEDDA